MAQKVIRDEYVGEVRERWLYDDVTHEVTVKREQDAQHAIDKAAAISSEGAPTIDGLGKPVAEIPVVVAMEWAQARGIPWEKLLYSNEYDAEFKRFVSEHQRLAYANRRTVHAVAG